MRQKIVHPPTVFAISIILEVLLHFYFPLATIIPPGFKNLGLGLIFVSLLLTFWQFFTMKGKTPIPYGSIPKALIKQGPFKFTRNAFYISIILICLGVAVYLRDITPFIIVVIEFFVFDKFLIPPEESGLEKIFGKSYIDYKKRVRRWI